MDIKNGREHAIRGPMETIIEIENLSKQYRKAFS